MPPPESKKDAKKEPLAEVEQALSILKGRHPEHERVRREGEEQKAARAREHAAEHQLAARRILLKRVRIGAVAVVGIGAIAVIGGSVSRESNRKKALDAAAAPFVSQGFTVVETSSRGDPTKLAAAVDPGCLLAVAVHPSPLKLTHPGGTIEGEMPILACFCEPVSVNVTSDKSAGGMALLRIDGNALGGSRAFPFWPMPGGTGAQTDKACADDELDAWLNARKPPPTAVTGDDATPPALKDVGFKRTAAIAADKPLGIVDLPAASCALVVQDKPQFLSMAALAPNVTKAAALLAAAGNLGWCASAASSVVMEREGKSAVTVYVAPAAGLGGMLGLQEAATKAGVSLAAMSMPASDREWNAKQILTTSWIPEMLVTTGIAVGTDSFEKESRIASLSTNKVGSLAPESPEGVFSFCDPPLEKSLESLCVFSGPQRWRVIGTAEAGLARATTPFWLFGFQNVSEPAALKRETQLITLARRLKRQRFEPTTIEAVTETENGAEVLGRANEDAVVAFTLAPTDPWVFPLAEPGAPTWALDGEPRVVPTKPLERLALVPPPKSKLPPKATRRTVVFRRHE